MNTREREVLSRLKLGKLTLDDAELLLEEMAQPSKGSRALNLGACLRPAWHVFYRSM